MESKTVKLPDGSEYVVVLDDDGPRSVRRINIKRARGGGSKEVVTFSRLVWTRGDDKSPLVKQVLKYVT